MTVSATLQTVKLKGHTLDVYVSPDLFLPNAVTRLFSKITSVRAGDTVFDIGTGVGVLAVWAALHPCREVHAVDPVERHCELAVRNAELHGVAEKVRVHQGSLFDPLPRSLKADVIIGDVSGIADAAARALGWYPAGVPTGGEDGVELIIQLLDRARERLTSTGRLYFGVGVGLSDSERVMETAEKCFGSIDRKVDACFPLSEQEYNLVSACLTPEVLAKLQRKGSRITWRGQLYEATSPRHPWQSAAKVM